MTVKEKAYAKINLYLDVTGRRKDGFHDIFSVMHSISLCDYLSVTANPSEKTNIIISTNDATLPIDENNLVYRSAAKYLSKLDINASVHIVLEKHIPVGAGLGGGSSDAAATLRALNRIFALANKEQLMDIASSIGSDVPFCLVGGIAICTGRGEKIEPFDFAPDLKIVVAIGKDRISTPRAYAELDKKYDNFADGSYVSPTDIHTPYNIFESITNVDEIEKIKEIMKKSGAEYTLMSGSGPSVFGVFKDACDTERACYELQNRGFSAFATISVYPEVSL